MAVPSMPLLALTQGDPAGVGPEILLKLVATGEFAGRWRPLLVAERAALEAVADAAGGGVSKRLHYLGSDVEAFEGLLPDDHELVPVLDPIGMRRTVSPGKPTAADACGAIAALDVGIELARNGRVNALVTAPLSKASIARHLIPGFRGHTDYLAAACGLEQYGRDYLMAFVAPDLKVALLSTHLPLREALDGVTHERLLAAIECLGRHAYGRIAVAGLNPHAGEEGLLGDEEIERIAPAIEQARRQGLDVHGPESPDSVFVRARRGEFDWVLALYHDQGLIAVKTAAFGAATNWTLGLPFLRTSVDHGTAFGIAGRGGADVSPLQQVVKTTIELLTERSAAAT